jgi:hypothetical protein
MVGRVEQSKNSSMSASNIQFTFLRVVRTLEPVVLALALAEAMAEPENASYSYGNSFSGGP